jgi:hypothetical protein
MLRDFLKDETATTAIEYSLVAAGLAVVMMTAVRPANPSLACPTCGLPMLLVTRIPKFSQGLRDSSGFPSRMCGRHWRPMNQRGESG